MTTEVEHLMDDTMKNEHVIIWLMVPNRLIGCVISVGKETKTVSVNGAKVILNEVVVCSIYLYILFSHK